MQTLKNGIVAFGKAIKKIITSKKKEDKPKSSDNGKSDKSGLKETVQKVGKSIRNKVQMVRWEIRTQAVARCNKKIAYYTKKKEELSKGMNADLQAQLNNYQKASTMQTLMRQEVTSDTETHSGRTSFAQHGGGTVG